MQKINNKSRKSRLTYKKLEMSKKLIKSITENYNYFNTTRWNAFNLFFKFATASSKARLVFKCIFKGSKNSVNKFYHYSRHVFRRLVQFGVLSGLKKASW